MRHPQCLDLMEDKMAIVRKTKGILLYAGLKVSLSVILHFRGEMRI